MKINQKEFASMLDGTLIGATDPLEETLQLLDMAEQYHFHSVFIQKMFYARFAKRILDAGIAFGLGSGASTMPTEVKCFMVEEGKKLGCNEFDMVMNIPAFKSGMYDRVLKDIEAVREASGDHVLKCIIETPLLSPEEIRDAVEICIDGGVDFIKTAVGMDGPTTIEQVELLSKAVRGRVKMKASGGIRTIETVDRMVELGVSRFGISYKNIMPVLTAAAQR